MALQGIERAVIEPGLTVEVLIDTMAPALADGSSRREAEKSAALAMLQRETGQ